MAEKLFSIRCETCGSRLAVRDANLIGHILSCPKCSSMVMVQPPEGWSPPGAEPSPGAATPAAATDSAAANLATAASTASASSAAPPAAGLSPTSASDAATLRDRWAKAASVAPPVDHEHAAAMVDVPMGGEDWMSPRQRWMRRYLAKIGAAAGGVIAAVALWYAFSTGEPPTEDTQAVDAQQQTDEKPGDAIEEPPTEAESTSDTDPGDLPAPRAPEPDERTEPAEDQPPTVVDRDVPIAVPTTPAAPGPKPAVGDAGAAAGEDAVVDDAPARPLRDPLPVVDVAARLSDTILKLDYVRTPLVDYLRVLQKLSTIPITLDADALAEAGLSPQTPVNVQATKKTVAEALDLALAPYKLRYVAVDQHVIVTTAEPDAAAAPVRREIGDLIRNEAEAARLARAIEWLVDPLSWRTQRTTTSLRIDGTGLVVVQSPRTMRKIDALLATLRAARRDPLGAAVSPSPALQTRHALARDALAHKITLNYTAPTPLEKIISRLEESAKLTILVDWQALAAEGVGPATPARMSATDVTVEEALSALVEPLFLTSRVIDERTVEITTLDALAGRAELAAHPLGDLASDAGAYKAIVEKLRAQFGPNVLEVQGKPGDGGVAWWVDEPSKTLLLLSPQDSQTELETYLREVRTARRQ